ncbi:glycosyltransferase family 2 protein [Bradyrhizobium diazoefficiens]|nr:glycosyltransferase [Bradyrhizobium diazoefficiens]MBR0849305.1 glycosyltransferase family 2 protein [Bradyrhizobium diazoefficiens]
MAEYLAAMPFFIIFGATTLLTTVFLIRQIAFSLYICFTRRSSKFADLIPHRWPTVTVLIPAQNEELVIGGCLDAMRNLDYPRDSLSIVVINDRSTDRTGEIAQARAAIDPQMRVYSRSAQATPGKPAAIGEVINQIDSEIVVFFDADYLPTPPLLKLLVAPFVDPEVGATMGRVVPYNTNVNLLTKLIDLERRAGYAVDQQARALLNMLPQFGGTVGGIRLSALRAIGGWRENILAEDTDLTYRLFIAGWTVEYLEHAMCYEESPETWQVRFRQVCRWAYGHNECALKYLLPILGIRGLGLFRRIDAIVVLLFYVYPALTLVCLFASLAYPLFYDYPTFNFTALSVLSFFVGFGNFSPYFQIAVAVQRDRQEDAAALMPLIFVSSAISMLASSYALLLLIKNRLSGNRFDWSKTRRFRVSST